MDFRLVSFGVSRFGVNEKFVMTSCWFPCSGRAAEVWLASWGGGIISEEMLLFRAKVPPDWWEKVRSNVASVLLDHAHLERRAATTALALERYRELYDRVEELNAIAMEELAHFQLVMNLLRGRGIPFGPALPSPWISGMMRSIRSGRRGQVIDHLLCCSLIEGRSCEKFQLLAAGFRDLDVELADFYGGLVESEGNHYSAYLLMARGIDERETERRLSYYLDLDAALMQEPNPRVVLH